VTEYRFETFEPQIVDGKPDARTEDYMQAVRTGFHDKRVNDEQMLRRTERAIADGRVFTAAYPTKTPVGALSTDIPVATFAHFEKQMNVGGGRLVPAHLITWVTVRPTHRRRGLLRSMMNTDLQQAADAGYPFAALTATEGGIYRRFGFGTATWYASYEVDTSPGLAFISEPDRRVEMCDPKELADLAPELYKQFQRISPGAAGRQQVYYDKVTGDLNVDTDEPDLAVRAALHYDEQGQPDGFVSYKFAGWDVKPGTIDVLDFVAVSDAAYTSLWSFLGAIDLVERVKFGYGAQESPLSWILSDPRRAKQVAIRDGVWLRMLHVVKALRARPWEVAGELTLSITDPLGHAEGVFTISADGRAADIQQIADEHDDSKADLAMGVSELGSLYLGGADPVVLTRAGRINQVTEGSAILARAMFGLERAPYAPNDF